MLKQMGMGNLPNVSVPQVRRAAACRLVWRVLCHAMP